MPDRRGTWDEVGVLCYVRDPNGTAWLVEEEVRGWRRLTTRDGRERRVSPRRPEEAVTIIEPAETQALETLRRILGAERVA